MSKSWSEWKEHGFSGLIQPMKTIHGNVPNQLNKFNNHYKYVLKKNIMQHISLFQTLKRNGEIL